MKKQRFSDDYPARRNARFVQRSRLQVTACEGCSRHLHTTHNFVFYGNWCRPCWMALQADGGVRVTQDAEIVKKFL